MAARSEAQEKVVRRSGRVPPMMRRDARERRAALIGSAARCFSEKGYTVTLEEIADRAGVGRGTLYRNFKDRMALALAVFERDVDALEGKIDLSRPVRETLREILHQGARASALFTRLAIELPLERGHLDEMHQLGSRLGEALGPLVEKAHAEGVLRADIGAWELLLSMRMISGLLLPQMSDEQVRERIDEALKLLLGGLRAA